MKIKQKIGTGLLAIVLALGAAAPARAQAPEPSAIDVHTLRQLLSAGEVTGKVTVINVSGLLACMDCRIPGSLCLACDDDKDKALFSSGTKNGAVIFYGSGTPVDPACNLIAEAGRQGFVNIHILTGGLPAWRRAGYPVESVKHIPRINSLAVSPRYFASWKQQAKNPIIIDIRPADLYQRDHLEGAVNIPLTSLHRLYQNIVQDHPLMIVDENDTQSFLAASYLMRKGFPEVTRLSGGMVNFRRGKK